jgi:hypothetical protein
LVFNDFTPIRVDDKGKAFISSVETALYGTYYNREATPVVEPVHMDDMPSGNYTLTVGNKYTVLVGAGGLSMRSYGIVSITGAITNITGDQINIGSSQEINIDGGRRVSIVADVLNIRPRDNSKGQGVINGNLGVTGNLTVAGGAHVEGELTVNSITAPACIQSTQETNAFAAASTDQNNGNGKIIGFGVPLYNYTEHNPTGESQKGKLKTNSKPAFIGISDKDKVVGVIKGSTGNTGKVIGYIPPYAVTTYNVAYGYNPNFGPYPQQNTIAIPIYAGNPGTPTVAAVNSTDVIDVIFGSDKQCIRGAFGDKGSGQGEVSDINNATASTLPIVIYGTGRDNDSFNVAQHSHMYKTINCTLKDANYEVRQVARTFRDSPRPATPVVNAPNEGESTDETEGDED